MKHIIVAVMVCAAVCQTDNVAVWDGDMFLIGNPQKKEKIRIANIDTDELEERYPYELEVRLALASRRGIEAGPADADQLASLSD